MLTNTVCKNAEIKNKDYKLADGGGLYLLIKSNGSKHWRLKYRYLGKEKLLAVGPYPVISLTDARERRDEAKRLLADNKDPVVHKHDTKRTAIRNSQNTFKAVALEWHEKQLDRWSEHHALNVMRRFDIDIFPYIGSRPIAEIDAPELLDVLRRIEKRGALDVAKRVKQICGQVLRYGIATGKCKRDHTPDLKGALKTARTKHYPALEIKEMPEFLKALDRNEPRLFSRTRKGILLLMLTFVRTSELIKSTWDEFDFEKGQWEIPAERMKTGKPHVVPLSRQAVKILKELKEETGHLKVKWVFPSQVRPRNHMSNNTLLFAIGRLGYKGRMTGHGFRALAMSTIKENLGYRHEVVDRQLAHDPKSKIDRAYDRAKFLDERKKMMQEWADYMDAVASQGKVVVANFKRKKA
jgi:integrase